MTMMIQLLVIFYILQVHSAECVTLEKGSYKGLVITISNDVPYSDCNNILNNLQLMLKDASSILREAIGAQFGDVTILLPSSWTDDCGRSVTSASGELSNKADVRITVPHILFANNVPWTQQSRGCGQPGDFISLSYSALQDTQSDLGRAFVKEWAKYRYGVFDETGIVGDPVYPTCYQEDNENEPQVTGCLDKTVDTAGLCNGTELIEVKNNDVAAKLILHPEATSSLMSVYAAPQIKYFCNSSTHNRYAPTKHNVLCDRRSVMDIISEHLDFAQSVENLVVRDISINYKREVSTRYVIVLADTIDMAIRESWSFLRYAIKKFAVLDIPNGSELGIVSVNSSDAKILQHLTVLRDESSRDNVASSVPYAPGGADNFESSSTACISCGVKTALEMFKESEKLRFPAATVIIIIAPGSRTMNQLLLLSQPARHFGTKITTINYPQLKHTELDKIAHATGGLSFTVTERKASESTSLFHTYFQLTQVFLAIRNEFYQGNRLNLPIEIYKREIVDDNRENVMGNFYVSPGFKEPSEIAFFSNKKSVTLLRSLIVESPSSVKYTKRSEKYMLFEMIKIEAEVNETGNWQYSIKKHIGGDSQPYYFVVSATPRDYESIVTAKMWTSSLELDKSINNRPLALYVEVKKGDWPVLDAKVQVKVTHTVNDVIKEDTSELLLMDKGNGDPDITANDGVYSRYYLCPFGPGLYQFEVTVSDNGNTAYSWQRTQDNGSEHCCGSSIWTQARVVVPEFNRDLPVHSVVVSDVPVNPPPGQIADLKVQEKEQKAKLIWTAPGEYGDEGTVSRYEIRYSLSLRDLADNFEQSQIWDEDVPVYSAGADSTFTLDLMTTPELLDKIFFVSIISFNSEGQASKMSNIVRVFVKSLVIPTPELGYADSDSEPAVVPHLSSNTGIILQVVLPVVAGAVVLAVCLGLYCVMVVRRRNNKHTQQVTQQANTPQPLPPPTTTNTITTTNTLQPNYEVDEKKLYMQQPEISVISPYESWSASQLLHEHERRHSPYSEFPHPLPPPPNHIMYPNNSMYASNVSFFSEESLYAPSKPTIFSPGSVSSVNSEKKRQRNVTMV